ncbi:MAG: hypothetical protein WBC02_10430 [Candidatus Aminicenantaceae bacterium]
MLRKGLFFMLLFIGIVHFSLGEEIYPKDFYITPRIGFSTLTGQIGIELQHKHVAFDIGYIRTGPPHEDSKQYLTYGIRYYFNPHYRTWYFGVGGGTDFDELHLGFIVGYRWRWGKGWDFCLGYGYLLTKEAPMIDLALGYSF